jgi:DNA-binding protein YbaB
MAIEHGLIRLQEAAERVAWQVDQSGVTGAGTDESGTVRVRLDDAGRVQQVDIGRTWWRGVGPNRLAEAILRAAEQAATDRMQAWSDRVAAREGCEPPVDWQSPMNRQQTFASDRDRGVPTAEGEGRVEELLRTYEITKAAMSEMDDYRHFLETRARLQVIGRSGGDRVTIAMAGGQLAEVEVSQRWLREQPSGQTVGSEVQAACQDAYNRAAQEESASLAGLPALAALRDVVADPGALLRRMGTVR